MNPLPRVSAQRSPGGVVGWSCFGVGTAAKLAAITPRSAYSFVVAGAGFEPATSWL